MVFDSPAPWPDGYKGIYIVISDMVPTHGKYSSDHSKKKIESVTITVAEILPIE